MSQSTLEQRVAALEKKVAELSAVTGNGQHEPSWTKTIGMFTDDPGMMEIFAEAMRIREADRKKARQRRKRGRRVES